MPGDHVKLNIANMLLLRYHALSKQCRLGQYFEMSIVLNYYHVHRAFTTQRFNIFQRETKQVSKKILLYNCVLSSIKLLQILLSTPITYTYQVWFFVFFFLGGGIYLIYWYIRLTCQQNPICVLLFTKYCITDIGP